MFSRFKKPDDMSARPATTAPVTSAAPAAARPAPATAAQMALAARPLLLLDEAPAHLDETRRAALFAEIEHLGLQAFMTGTEPALFAALEGRAQMVRVLPGALES